MRRRSITLRPPPLTPPQQKRVHARLRRAMGERNRAECAAPPELTNTKPSTPSVRLYCCGIFAIRTYSPQIRVVSTMLDRAAGIDQSNASSLVSGAPLRIACAMGTIQLVYSGLAGISSADDAPRFATRAEMYARLFRRAIESTIVELDVDGDGAADLSRHLGVTQFVRR